MDNLRTSTSQNVLVLVNSASASYYEYQYYTEPYMRNFGMPYDLVDMSSGSYTDYQFGYYALILFGHSDVFTSLQYPDVLTKLESAIALGVGLFSLDTTLLNYPSALCQATDAIFQSATGFDTVNTEHYVSNLHATDERITLHKPVHVAYNSRLVNSSVLLSGGGAIVLEIGTFGAGRIVRWNTTQWMDIYVKGPLGGLDDLLWRGMAWAARKPFVMQGMPHFLTFRVDDVTGSGTPPLYWIANANTHGFIPWCGIDTDMMSPEAIRELKRYADNGQATVSPHTFTQNDGNFMWFNHHATTVGQESGGPLTDALVQANEIIIRDWFKSHGIAMSTYFIAHWYEMGANSVRSMYNLGAQFILTNMPPDEFLTNGGDTLQVGPYRKYQTWKRFFDCEVAGATENTDERNQYYADDAPFDPRLFLVGTEIHEDAGYEWWPTNDVAGTIGRGSRQLKRCFDSMVLATLFTHESAGRIEKVTPENIEREFAGVAANIASYHPIPITLDEGCKYVRAKTRLRLTDVVPSGNHYVVCFSGTNDMLTKAYLFTNKGTDGVNSTLFDVPQANGAGQVVIA